MVEVPDGDPADPPYVVIPYVDEMQYAYAAADFVICRSGAMTRAELAAVGLPAAYVPLPLRGGEQRLNAEPVVAAGGALLVDNADLDPAWIETILIPVLTDPERIAAMSARRRPPGGTGRLLARWKTVGLDPVPSPTESSSNGPTNQQAATLTRMTR